MLYAAVILQLSVCALSVQFSLPCSMVCTAAYVPTLVCLCSAERCRTGFMFPVTPKRFVNLFVASVSPSYDSVHLSNYTCLFFYYFAIIYCRSFDGVPSFECHYFSLVHRNY
jgi:hypothetical protein